jgi:hypothetical protein
MSGAAADFVLQPSYVSQAGIEAIYMSGAAAVFVLHPS